MVMDIIVIAVVVLSTVIHGKKGFAVSFVNFVGWIAGIVLSFLFFGKLRAFLCDHTRIDDSIHDFISNKIVDKVGSSSLVNNAPSIVKDPASSITGSFVGHAADSVTNLVMGILSFFLILLAVRIVGLIFVMLFSKRHHHGVIGTVDTVGGVVLGLIMGAIYVLVGLTILYFLINVLPEKTATFIQGSLDNSHICGIIYDKNPLLHFIQSLTAK